MFIHDLPFLQSISESATIANKVAPILPYCLGALSLFALSYAITLAYDRLDRILTLIIFAGFTVVAMQMCVSPYVTSYNVGVLGLSQHSSGIIHNIAAIISFAAMTLWVLICFNKSNLPVNKQTPQKQLRNKLYTLLGLCMTASLSLFIFYHAGILPVAFPIVFVVETLVLTFGGTACLLKGGMFLKDKDETHR